MIRRSRPIRPLIERHLAGESVTSEEFLDAASRMDLPRTYRTRYPGWDCDVTISPDGTTLHLPERDVLIHGESQDEGYV